MVASKSVEFARDAFPNAGNEAPLFDHLVGAHQHRLRNREAERLGCVEVYQERTMVITMPESLVTLFEVAMAAEGLGFECVGEGSLTSEYIVNAPIEQIRETIAKAAAESIEVTIPDDAKA